MSKKIKMTAIAFLLFPVITGCSSVNDNKAVIDNEIVRALIIGSAEHPDPVLKMVHDLEKKGILKNVIVRESFPVQIDVTGPKDVIKKLKAIPKEIPPEFK